MHESSVLHLLLNPFREKPIKHFMKNRTPLINIILFGGFRSYDGMSSNQEIKEGALVWTTIWKNLNEFQTPLMAALRDLSVPCLVLDLSTTGSQRLIELIGRGALLM